ncbi:predicted protein [Aspergillus terreus NIH2624]|uniref:Uncharacterized protein n=1 Tax=Aspergillus terreus (strain NIH 2624 / FGSC A1156) TaxID=341663 RepID=Q0CDR8_ASPTN|nr:uncharacterized protein ATEG_08166 [Aspergillus terreus NIH2624]EAU31339.1 predicted protein [Aspergillus terreus NIH2624]
MYGRYQQWAPSYGPDYRQSYPAAQPPPPPYQEFHSPPARQDERISESQLREEERPVVIPRVTPNNPLKPPGPFLRAYSPVLRNHDVQITDFLEFVDNLSVAQAGSPALSAVNAAGMAVSMVPSHWASIAGTGIQVAAGVGTAAVSKIRTKKFLEAVNERYFGPRGLQASIKKDDELVGLVGFPRNAPPLAPVNPSTGCITLRDRRMAALGPCVSPLTTDVPPPTKQAGMLDKIAAKQLEKTAQKTESKELRKHQRTQDKQDKRERRAMEKQDRRDRRRGRPDRGYEDPTPYARAGYYGDYPTHRHAGDASDSDASLEAIDQERRRLVRASERLRHDSRYGQGDSQTLMQLESERYQLDRRLNSKMDRRGQRQQMKDEKKLQHMDYIVIVGLV